MADPYVDGMEHGVKGLEDASKYPDLIAELIHRGWSDNDLIALMGGNLMRVMDAVDAVQESLLTEKANPAVWEGRNDLPASEGGWGQYVPDVVREWLLEKGKTIV